MPSPGERDNCFSGRRRTSRKAQTVRGPAFPPALSCAETWICRCSSAWRPEGLLLLDPGAPAQVRFPPRWLRGTSLSFRIHPPRRTCWLLPVHFARPVRRPFERPGSLRPSWAGPLSRGLLSWGKPPFAIAGTNSSGASDRLVRKIPCGPLRHRSEEQFSFEPGPSIACRRRSVLPSSPRRPAVAGALLRRGLPSRSPMDSDSDFRVAQSGILSLKPVDNGDMAHNLSETPDQASG